MSFSFKTWSILSNIPFFQPLAISPSHTKSCSQQNPFPHFPCKHSMQLDSRSFKCSRSQVTANRTKIIDHNFWVKRYSPTPCPFLLHKVHLAGILPLTNWIIINIFTHYWWQHKEIYFCVSQSQIALYMFFLLFFFLPFWGCRGGCLEISPVLNDESPLKQIFVCNNIGVMSP